MFRLIDAPVAGQAWRAIDVLVVSPTPTHPQDHGNRKRIFEICSALKRQGARIHFVHYPGEHDWRHERPALHEDAMKAVWDTYQLVAPSRPLHSPPHDIDHTIDEWADPDLQHYLVWACRLRSYDLAIVNYTWMSFCLDSIPKDVFKICDTHDVFGERRQLLEANGIAAEFFHTTKIEEARGLARADLVWAIKRSEQSYFENELKLPNCLTMLHSEVGRGWWSNPPSNDGWLRAGVIGARNNINRRNLEQFLHEALPFIQNYMAPVKIVIAGGCADDFASWNHPNVEILGRVGEVEEFYRSVDVVIAPLRFSTGLKIKVAEALASGAPLVAHAHAMEGFPSDEPLHRLESFGGMALELVKLAFDRAPLSKLAWSSHDACAAIRRNVDAALDASRCQLMARLSRTICVVAPMEALDPKSLLYDQLHAALEYLRFTSKLALFIMGARATAPSHILDGFDQNIRVFVDPTLARELGSSRPDAWTAIELSHVLETRGFERAYILSDCRSRLTFGHGKLRDVFLRHDAVELSGGDADLLIESLRADARVHVIGSNATRMRKWLDEFGIAGVYQAPFRRLGLFESLTRRSGQQAQDRRIVILGRINDPISQGLVDLVKQLELEPSVHDPADTVTANRLMCAPASKDDPLNGFNTIRMLVDLTMHDNLAIVLGEAAQRLGIPVIRLLRGSSAIGAYRFRSPLLPTTIAALLRSVADASVDGEAMNEMRAETRRNATARFTGDAGWTLLWKALVGDTRSKEIQSTDVAEALFGA